MDNKKSLYILFIGNSHTYYNDMPLMVQDRAIEEGYDCRVVMIAHGGWFLAQHVDEPDVRFNILNGGYDYVVLQEHAHPFGPVEKFRKAAMALCTLAKDGGSRAVIYGTWAKRSEPGAQAAMNEAYRQVAEDTGALLAPVGEHWWGYQESHPKVRMYATDGKHASAEGSDFAASWIWATILEDLKRKG